VLLFAFWLAAGCAYSYRQGASTVASSREAAVGGVPNIPPLHYGLEVRPPVPAGVEVPIPWVELEGRVGSAELFEADTVIALDMSTSANFPSGLDLDEDGIVGEVRGVVRAIGSYDPKSVQQGAPPPLPPSQWTTDVGDTVAALEVAAARALVTGLGQRRNRIGVLSYADRGHVRQDVGTASGAQASLGDLRPSTSTRGTDIYAALRRAREMLNDAPPLPGFPRQRAVLLFTDGQPVEPVEPYIARIRANQAAADLARAGIDLYVFSFGRIGVEQAKFLLELARSGSGRLYRVGDPERMLADLPPVDLTPSWLRIENATSGQPARGIETQTDGHFAAFVPLEAGENRVRVLAELGNGKLQRWEGVVVHQPGDPESQAQRDATRRVLELIEQRDRASDTAAGPPAQD